MTAEMAEIRDSLPEVSTVSAIGSGTGNAVYNADSSKELGTKIFDSSANTDISEKLELAGVYDSNPDRMKWAAERGFTLYESFDAVLKDASVDIVLVATPNHLHREMSRGNHTGIGAWEACPV